MKVGIHHDHWQGEGVPHHSQYINQEGFQEKGVSCVGAWGRFVFSPDLWSLSL